MSQNLIAVIDIGKTNAKLHFVDEQTGETTGSVEKRSKVIQGHAFRELDISGTEEWLLSALSGAPGKKRIRAVVPVTHGAAVVLVSERGEPLAAPDYEDPIFESVSESYSDQRDSYELTYSPSLPLGLNLGRQLYYLQQQHPDTMHRCQMLLLYPQYWAWRLSDVSASEITSLGCHTDLWRPTLGRFSSLAVAQGWDTLLPALRNANDELGTISRNVAELTGLDRKCQVLCGIHDSNASYLCHREGQLAGQNFAVVSSGTWTVIMAHGTDLTRLRENRGMLANIDACHDPVATARFMGGQEYEAIAGTSEVSKHPTPKSLERVIQSGALALPSVSPAGEHLAGQEVRLINAEGLDEIERGALATLYCSLQTDLLLDWLGSSGVVIIDGPLATNPLYGSVLATLRPGSSVLLSDSRSGPIQCARILRHQSPKANLRDANPLAFVDLDGYRALWRFRAESPFA
jgi:L-fuculokinase